MQWLCENWQNLLVGGIVCAVITLVIVFMVRAKKKGKSGCSCGHDCGSCGGCEQKEKIIK